MKAANQSLIHLKRRAVYPVESCDILSGAIVYCDNVSSWQ